MPRATMPSRGLRIDGLPRTGAPRRARRADGRRSLCALRPSLESMEDRTLLSTTWTVNSNADTSTGSTTNHNGTLRFCIGNAADGDTVVFGTTTGTINVGSTLPVGVNLTITGPGAGSLKLQATGTNYSILTFASGKTDSISGLTIASGNATHGGGIDNSGTLTASGITFSGNNASNGGGLYNESGASATLTSDTFSGNTATNGGGIDNSGTLNATGITFSSNSASAGGGLYDESGAHATLTSSAFSSNTAADGGGIYNDGGTVTVAGDTFTSNGASNSSSAGFSGTNPASITDLGNGGGIYNAGTLAISGTTSFTSNTASNSGNGVIRSIGGTLTAATVTNSGNGGGIYVASGGTVTMGSGTLSFSSNSATNTGAATVSGTEDPLTDSPVITSPLTLSVAGNGGGIYNGGTITVSGGSLSFSSNSSSNSGSGVLTNIASSSGGLIDIIAASLTNTGNGGGVFNGGTFSVSPATTFTGNTATNSGSGPLSLTVSQSAIPSGSHVTITNPVSSSGDGGGIYNDTGQSATFSGGSTFKSNTASNSGSGVLAQIPTLSPPTIINNVITAGDGGAVFNDGTLSLTNSTIGVSGQANSATNTGSQSQNTGSGGGFYNFVNATAQTVLTGGSVSFNTASNLGGGIANAGALSISAFTIAGNSASNGSGNITGGGGIYNGGGVINGVVVGTLSITASTISGNSADDGGGIKNQGATLTITNSTIANNTATGNQPTGSPAGSTAGGIANDTAGVSSTSNQSTLNAVVTLTNDTISGNSVTNSAAIEFGSQLFSGKLPFSPAPPSPADSYGQANITLANTIVANGASRTALATASLNGSTISGITVTDGGSGYTSAPTVTLIGSGGLGSGATATATVSGGVVTGITVNTAGTGYVGPVTVFLSGGGVSPDTFAFNTATFTSSGHNLVSDGSAGLSASGDISSVNALLATLANYGGSIQTIALLPGSPAINAGSNALATGLTTDERGAGFNRIVNGTVDIGAFESRGFTLATVSGGGQSATVATGFTNPLIVTVSSSFGEPVIGGVVTFSAPGSGASATFPTGNTASIGAGGLTSENVTANTVSGTYNVTASASGASSVQFSLTNTAGASASIAPTSGTPQIVATNGQAGTALQATVHDRFGNPVPNVTVTFAAPGSGASGTFLGGGTATTNAQGIATAPTYTANGTSGSYTITATVGGVGTAANFSLINTPDGTAKITPVTATESTTVNTAFTALQVHVTDNSNDDIAGISVTFTAPSTAPSGTFSGGLASVTVTTNAQGIATAPFTADTVSGSFSVVASAVGISPSAQFNLTNNPDVPASIAPVSGTSPQNAPIGTAFAALKAVVTDRFGNVVPNVSVTFAAPATGATGAFSGSTTVTTDANGIATAPTFTANNVSGSYVVTAAVNGSSPSTPFLLTNAPGVATTITVVAGTPQNTGVGGVFGTALQAKVVDPFGNPVAGVSVVFAAPTTGASGTFAGGLSNITATTNSQGIATATAFSANSVQGSYTVTASVTGILTNAQFQLTNTVGAAANVTVFTGSLQATTVNTTFGAPLQALVTDRFGNSVPNISVTFADALPGPGGTFLVNGTAVSTVTITTDSNGLATSPAVTANKLAGGFVVTASVAGVSTPAQFTLINTIDVPALVFATAGSLQSAAVTSAFGTELLAKVTDQFGNAEPGVPVIFAAPTSGASGTFAGGFTTVLLLSDANGFAAAPVFTANTVSGAYAASATITASQTPGLFNLTNTPGGASSIVTAAGTPQSAVVGTVFSTALQAEVLDPFGNPVPGVSVSFAAPTTGPTGTFPNSTTPSVVTNALGIATAPAFTANGVLGTYTVNASASGASSPAPFTLTNTVGSPARISVASGTPQTTAVGTAFSAPFQALVADRFGNPVPGASVTFAAPSNTALGTFAGGVSSVMETTNAQGIATSPTFTAGSTLGNYSVTASVSGLSGAASFALTNTVGAPSNVIATAGTPQSAQVAAVFSKALQAKVTDVGGNVLSGVSVVFAAPLVGASGAFTGGLASVTVTTNSQGIATAPVFTANALAGSFTVTASVNGVANPATFSLTNILGAPTNIVVSAGTPQSAVVGTAFGAAFQAKVTNSTGIALPNISVTFTAPSSGARGTFPGGLATAVVTTDAQGIATSPIFTAGSSLGSYVVTASVSGLFTTAKFSLTNTVGPPASVLTASGTPQTAQVGAVFAQALQAKVTDVGGNVLSGVSVVFAAPLVGASGAFTGGLASVTETTNSAGIAVAPVFTANGLAGSFAVTASVNGVTNPATFSLTNILGAPTNIVVSTGTPQSAVVGTAFGAALQAKVTNSTGIALPNISVTFTAPSSGARGTFPGGLATAVATTNAQGIATSPMFTAGTTLGAYSVTASVSGLFTTASFKLTNTAGPPASVLTSSGTPQSAQVGAIYSQALQAKVTDVGGNVLSGVSVVFAAPLVGASGAFTGGLTSVTETTNSQGIAVAPVFTANALAGSFAVTASVNGVATPATFSLTNILGAPTNIVVNAGTPQSAVVGTAFGSAFQAKVTNSTGIALPNVSVTFTAPSSGVRGTFAGGLATAVVTTNAQGIATSPVFTAGTTPGVYSVTASVSGLFTTARFNLTNTVGTPASLVTTAGTPQTATVHTTFNGALQAKVTDQFGNPVPNASVVFTAPATGAGGTFTGGLASVTAVSNAAGLATTPAFTANTVAGSYAITARVNGVATAATFLMTNRPGAAALIAIVSGTPQSASLSTAFATPLEVVIADQFQNPIPGAIVTFAAPTSGARGTFAPNGVSSVSVPTNANGVAIAPVFTANNVAGSYKVTATTSGIFPGVSFALSNTTISMMVVSRSTTLIKSQSVSPSRAPGGVLALAPLTRRRGLNT